MQRRQLARTDVELSAIGFGSMRLRADERSAVDLLRKVHDAGITTVHSSSEYDSYDVTAAAIASLRREGRGFEHVVKLAEPSFDETGFDADRVSRAIDAELGALSAERIDVVQWMVRGHAAGDRESKERLVEEWSGEIEDTFAALRTAGKIGSVLLFPYVTPAVESLLGLRCVDGLCGYLNLAELELAPTVSAGTSCVALRPLAAGLLGAVEAENLPAPLEPKRANRAQALAALDIAPADLPQIALRFPLLSPQVASTIISISSAERLEQAVDWAAGVDPDAVAFDSMLTNLGRGPES